MSSVPDSIFEIRVRMYRNRTWSDLPHDILGLVMQKLRFSDQMRLISVCKNWRYCKEFVRNSNCQPWVMCHSSTCKKRSKRYSFKSELFHPSAPEKVRAQVLTSVGRWMNPNNSWLYPFASKDSWVLLGGKYSKLFLHNPFTNKVIETDLDASGGYTFVATILGSPWYPGCKIFTAMLHSDFRFYINSYCLSSKSVESVLVDRMKQSATLYSVLYMKGKLYCLLEDGRLNSYSFEDKEWTSLTEGFGKPYVSWRNLRGGWLMEIEEKLVVVCMTLYCEWICEWMIFRFDWTDMAWVRETSLESRAIFISGCASWSAALIVDCGKKLRGCKVFYDHKFTDVAHARGFKCYSLTHEAGQGLTTRRSSQEETEWYGWISRPDRYFLCFVQPPYSGI